MKRATGNGETVADDLVTCLSKAVAASGRPPRIVTLSAAPVANVMAHVFGPDATVARISRRGPGPAFTRADGAPGSPLDVDPATFATVARVVDAETFDRLRAAHRPWLTSAAAILLQFQPGAAQIDDLASAGFSRSLPFAAGGRKTTVFLPSEDIARPARDAASLAGRPGPARLVIVDPCLGRAAGGLRTDADRGRA